MKRALVWSIFAVKAFAGEETFARQEPDQASISVGVYNYAAIPAEDLRLVKQQVFRILGDAGIYTVFMDCPPSAAELDQYPGCTFGRQPVELVLRVRPGLPPRELVRSSTVFGFAFLPDAGGPGTFADVYAGGAEMLAKGSKALEPVMLSALIAHEIGHLVLGTNRHSVAGLMRSPWGTVETVRAAQGCLRFLDKEGDKMRANARTYRAHGAELHKTASMLSGRH
jgi:hypothetical protein